MNNDKVDDKEGGGKKRVGRIIRVGGGRIIRVGGEDNKSKGGGMFLIS